VCWPIFHITGGLPGSNIYTESSEQYTAQSVLTKFPSRK
jgi:hypothetical protein